MEAIPLGPGEVAARREKLERLAALAVSGPIDRLAALIVSRRDKEATTWEKGDAARPSPVLGSGLNPHARLLQDACQRVGLPTAEIPAETLAPRFAGFTALRIATSDGDIYYFYQQFFRAAPDGKLGEPLWGDVVYDAGKKYRTKQLLHQAGVPTPEGALFNRETLGAAFRYAAAHSGEVCVKPNIGANGTYVFPWLRTADDIFEAVVTTADRYDAFVIETSVAGQAWRFFYVEPEIVGIKIGRPANVVGDGQHSIASLIGLKQAERARRNNLGHTAPLPTGAPLDRMLRRQGLTLASIPGTGRRVFLSPCANGSRGAESLTQTGGLHPEYHEWMIRAFQALPGLRVGAADVMIRDTAKPDGASFDVLEINPAPALLAYHYPWEGPVHDISTAIAQLLKRLPPHSHAV